MNSCDEMGQVRRRQDVLGGSTHLQPGPNIVRGYLPYAIATEFRKTVVLSDTDLRELRHQPRAGGGGILDFSKR